VPVCGLIALIRVDEGGNFSEQSAKLTLVDLLSSYLESLNYPLYSQV
jgi:hypothetical protein